MPAECVNDTLFVTVNPLVNNPPDALPDNVSVSEDTTNVVIDVQDNDSDLDGDILTTTIVSGPTSGGTAIITNNDSITYTPPTNFNGADTIVYQICDPSAACDTDTIFIDVVPVNDAPSQGNEALTVTEDDPATTSTDLTTNNTDVDGTATSVTTVVSSSGGGTTSITGGGTTIDYAPAASFTGIDTVIYTVCDAGTPMPAECVNDTLFVTVNPLVNNPPDALPDNVSVSEDTTNVVIDVQDNDTDADGDVLTTTIVSGPTSGGTAIITNNDSITYTPPTNFNGADTIVYQICDPSAACDTDTIFIDVVPVNDAPSQGNEALTVTEDDPATTSTDLTTNNTDIDGTATSVTTVVSSSGGGTISITGSGTTIDYAPAASFTGIDTVIYTVCDAGTPMPAECVNDTLFVTVNPLVNNPPDALPDNVSVSEDTTNVVIDVQDNDTDADGDVLTTTIVSGPTSGGTATITNNDSITYTPPTNFNGADTIVYQICDPSAACDTDTIFIDVVPVNDAPSQGNEALTVTEDDPATTSTDLTTNNTDVDGTATSVTTVVSSSGGGTTSITGGGTTIDYAPAASFTGIDTVIYTVCDAGNTHASRVCE